MRLLDPFAHASWRTAAEYRALAAAGVEAVVEPSTSPGLPRRHPGACEEYFASLLGWEPHRAARAGVRHFCALGLGPREAADPGLAEAALWLLPRLLDKDPVVGVGEVGLEELTPAEEEAVARQAELARARGLPLLARLCPLEPRRSLERLLGLLRDGRFPERLALVVGCGESTLPQVLDAGLWAGVSLHPRFGLDARAAAGLARRYGPGRLLLGSGCDWDDSDALALPAVAAALEAAGVTEAARERLLWDGPVRFYGQSGRLVLAPDASEEALAP